MLPSVLAALKVFVIILSLPLLLNLIVDVGNETNYESNIYNIRTKLNIRSETSCDLAYAFLK
jgi:hypothetical protein